MFVSETDQQLNSYKEEHSNMDDSPYQSLEKCGNGQNRLVKA